MRVIGWSSCPEPWQQYPFPKTKFGIVLGIRGGNVVQPLGEGRWFDPPYFTKVLSFYLPIPILPFFSIRLGRFGFYIGAKAFGVDSEHYLNWLPPQEVYDGSVAIMLCSMRFTGALE